MTLQDICANDNILFAKGHICNSALEELATGMHRYRGCVFTEPYFDALIGYGFDCRYTKDLGISFQEYLQKLLENSGWKNLSGVSCPVVIVKQSDSVPFGQAQAEALFNGLKSIRPHVPSALLLHHGDEREAVIRAVQWIREKEDSL